MTTLRCSDSSVSPILLVQKYTSFDRDVAPIFSNAVVQANVCDREDGHALINATQCFENLMLVDNSLRIAYTDAMTSNGVTAELLASYEALVDDVYLSCKKFLSVSMEVMEYHQLALQMLKTQRLEASFQVLALSSKVAEMMIKIADALIKKSQHTSDLACAALITAFEPDASERGMDFALALVTAVMGTQRAISRVARFREERLYLQDHERNANVDIADAIEALRSTTTQNDSVTQALDITIRALESVTTACKDACAYLTDVQGHCSVLKAFQDTEEFVEAITDSWFSWLVVGKTYNSALSAMKTIQSKVSLTVAYLQAKGRPDIRLLKQDRSVSETLTDASRINRLITITDIPTFCIVACGLLNSLQEDNDQECNQLEEECRHIQSKLERASASHVLATNRLEMETKEKLKHEAFLARQGNEMSALRSAIHEEEGKIQELRNTISRERQCQSNAAYDLIPFHGIFSAIISGDAKRAIPFYSQIDGIVSAVENELAAATQRLDRSSHDINRLRQQSDETRSAIETTRASIDRLTAEAAKSQRQIDQCDRNSKIALEGV